MNRPRFTNRFERRLRFGCGSVFGAVLASVIVVQAFRPGSAVVVLLIIISCGLMVAHWGDRCWQFMFEAFS